MILDWLKIAWNGLLKHLIFLSSKYFKLLELLQLYNLTTFLLVRNSCWKVAVS